MENEIRVRFVVTGFTEEPEVITDLLKIDPDETWRAGDLMQPSIRIHQENGWELASQLDNSTAVGDQVRELLDRLEPAKSSLNGLSGAYREFSCVLYAYDGVPEIHFSSDTLRRVSELGASIDVDLYCMEDEKCEEE